MTNNPLNKGILTDNFNGSGSVTIEKVRARARELALIAGRSTGHVTPADFEQAKRELTGEPGVPLLERVWARPTLEVHGIRGGFTGEGAKTVIPARAVAKISTRLVGDQLVDEAIAQTKAAVVAACPKGVTAELKVLSAGAPSLTNPDNPFIGAAAEALKQTFGQDTVYIRSGGSIPIVGVFDRYLGIPSVMMGFGLPDDNLHAPNEKFHIPNFYRGIESICLFFEKLGE